MMPASDCNKKSMTVSFGADTGHFRHAAPVPALPALLDRDPQIVCGPTFGKRVARTAPARISIDGPIAAFRFGRAGATACAIARHRHVDADRRDPSFRRDTLQSDS